MLLWRDAEQTDSSRSGVLGACTMFLDRPQPCVLQGSDLSWGIVIEGTRPWGRGGGGLVQRVSMEAEFHFHGGRGMHIYYLNALICRWAGDFLQYIYI